MRWYKRRACDADPDGLSSGSVTTNVVDALESPSAGRRRSAGSSRASPAGDRLLADAAVWLTGEYADAVRSTRQRTLAGGDAALAVDLHPAVAAAQS